uniref:non-specific serine/threonine protein kinase n=2 Tax=Panagrellus redivivus TaxID=6233 RepID=A0A7E4V009_PANRE
MKSRRKNPSLSEQTPRDQRAVEYLSSVLPATDPIRIANFGTRFSHCQVLGSGRFGAVEKLADSQEDGRFAAAKIVNISLFNHWTQDMGKIKRRIDDFLREYRRIQSVSINSDRIADFLGVAVENQKFILLSEFAEAGSVKDAIKETGLDEDIALKYFYQTVEALLFLHSQPEPIVHTDVKAANLLLSSSDNIKLANFGLVRDLTTGGFGMAVASEIAIDFRGTLLYLSPEVLTSELGPGDRRSYDPPADIWALGCTFVEMLTRFPPYFEFYEDRDNFYMDFTTRASKNTEQQLPYDCFSLVASASTPVRFLVNKVFDKDPVTRISALGLQQFLQAVAKEAPSHRDDLEEEFQRAYTSTKSSCGKAKRFLSPVDKKRNLFASIKALSTNSVASLRVRKKGSRSAPLKEDIELALKTDEEERDEETPVSKKRRKKRNRRKNHDNCKDLCFCLKYTTFRVSVFGGLLCKAITKVTAFVFFGLGALAIFFCLATGTVYAARLVVLQLCEECDLNTPPVLIISGIFVILLFALLFSCCMVALGEYKFRMVNKSLHKSRLFVPRPSKDIRLFGVRVVRSKRNPENEIDNDIIDDADEVPEVTPKLKDVDLSNYADAPTPVPTVTITNEDDDEVSPPIAFTWPAPSGGDRRPTIIEEEPSRKNANPTFSTTPPTMEDLYGDRPSPTFR